MTNNDSYEESVPRGIDPELWEFLVEWDEEHGIVDVLEPSRSVRISKRVFKTYRGASGRDEARSYIKDNAYEVWERKILFHILRRCYDPTLPRGTQPTAVTFEELQRLYERLTGKKSRSIDDVDTTIITTTTEDRKNDCLSRESANITSRVTADLPPYPFWRSDGGRGENSKNEGIESEKEGSGKVGSEAFDPKDFALSGVTRNHNGLFKASVENRSELGATLKKIEIHFLGDDYEYPKNKWATVVKKEEGRGYTLRIHEYGSLNLHVPALYSLDAVRAKLREDLSFLSQEDFDYLVDSLVPSFGHFASAVYPEKLVEKYLAGAQASIWLLGEKLAEAGIDKSAGAFELELKGNYFLCALLQEKMLLRETVMLFIEETRGRFSSLRDSLEATKREISDLKERMANRS